MFIHKDILIEILSYMKDHDKIRLIICSKELYVYRLQIKFDDCKHLTASIYNLDYYHMFTNIIVTNYLDCKPMISLPSNLQKLTLDVEFEDELLLQIPNSVEKITINNLNDIVPIFSDKSILNTLTIKRNIEINSLKKFMKPTLKNVFLTGYFNQSVEDLLPLSVKNLFIGHHFVSIKKNFIPPNVTHLIIMPYVVFNFVMPSKVTNLYLNLHPNIMHKLNLIIPRTVTNLFLSFNQKLIPGDLPPNLISLHFGYKFNHPVDPKVLPDTIIDLGFNDDYNQNINHVLPKNLSKLSLGENFNRELILPDHIHLSVLKIYSTAFDLIKTITKSKITNIIILDKPSNIVSSIPILDQII